MKEARWPSSAQGSLSGAQGVVTEAVGGDGVTWREESSAVFRERDVWMGRERRLLWQARYRQRHRGVVTMDVETADCLRRQKGHVPAE